MIEKFVSEFIISLTSGIIMITIVDLVLPETDVKKYIIKICGLILMILIFSPIVHLAKNRESFDVEEFTFENESSLSDGDQFYSRYYFDEYYVDQQNNN